jgi:hypothetical protein
MKKLLLIAGIGVMVQATPFWTRPDFEKAAASPRGPAVRQAEAGDRGGDWQRWSYIHELVQTARFVANMQVSDTLNPEYGGVIEGEDQMTLVQTDNTQEAIWIWCRYYEIIGDTAYFPNIRKAWVYVMHYPAYNEENSGSDYYRVWNCGLALFAETKYHGVFNDTAYAWYADTCARFILSHPLSFTVSDPYYRQLHPKVTGLAAGMLYQYGKRMGNQNYQDSALAYGNRVKTWIEADPTVNINDEVWAMSGGTCVWGLCRSVFDADTAAGVAWLNSYLPDMKYFQPNGTWNNSWNIWYANAYNFSGRISGNGVYLRYHHYLTDSLLVQDFDDDGGVPPTRGWSQSQDHSWVSNYMVFMGFEGLIDSIKTFDAGVSSLSARGRRPFFLIGDSLRLSVVAANYGFSPISNVLVSLNGPINSDTTVSFSIGEEDTIRAPVPWVPGDTGTYAFSAVTFHVNDQRPDNDTIANVFRIRPRRAVAGAVSDTTAGHGVYAKLYFQFLGDTGRVYFDSAFTDSASGVFHVNLIDSMYQLDARTDIPYPDFSDSGLYVSPDSTSAMYYGVRPADLLIVNRDYLGRYASYYTVPLDSLNIRGKVWTPVDQGVFPFSRINEFNHDIIIWYTGQTATNNIIPAEQESLITFLEGGGRLLISGQNIGEELNNSPFYRNYLHARLVSNSNPATRSYPDPVDSLGNGMGRLFTSGGAQNQYSRDVIDADSLAHRFLYYDSTLVNGAGIWYNDPLNNSKIIYLGFGIEAVHKPPSWTGFMSRKALLSHFLNWFGLTGIGERTDDEVTVNKFELYPNPARSILNIQFMFQDAGCMNNNLSVKIYDINGRLVKSFSISQSLSPNPSALTWRCEDNAGRRVPAGVYFVRLENSGRTATRKAIILK